MSKIRTPDQLNEMLHDAITWRKAELRDIKSLIQTSTFSSSKLNCLLRSGVALLYAHWEGFVKESGTAYLEFVSMQGLKYDELAPNFIALAMKARLNEAGQTNKAIIHNEIVKFFLLELSTKSHISYDNAISTESNLSSKVLENIIYILGLDYSHYRTKAELIDEKLLKNRNHIAHGKHLIIDKSEFMEIFEEIVKLMELFYNQISNAAITEAYKRQANF